MRRVALPLIPLLLLISCAGTSDPVALSSEELGFSVTRNVEPVDSIQGSVPYTMNFVRRDRLARVRRELRTDLPAAEALVRALLEGPTKRERDRGLTTQIPEATRLLAISVIDTVAEVDLSAEFQTPAPSDTILLRVAQVVFTLVAVPGITAVRFAIDGEPISVVTENGAPVERPVTAPDYAGLGPA